MGLVSDGGSCAAALDTGVMTLAQVPVHLGDPKEVETLSHLVDNAGRTPLGVGDASASTIDVYRSDATSYGSGVWRGCAHLCVYGIESPHCRSVLAS
jgi:hypothetical protein